VSTLPNPSAARRHDLGEHNDRFPERCVIVLGQHAPEGSPEAVAEPEGADAIAGGFMEWRCRESSMG
jgi:hypothetical protein